LLIISSMWEMHEPTIFFKSSEKMNEIQDETIQLIITSPPYGKIKDYGNSEQIGFFESFETYFKRLNNVWNECYRVLEPQCRLCINVGDQYLRTSSFGRYHILSIASKTIQDCIDIGFDYLGDIIWQKVSTTNPTGGCSLMGSIYYPRNGLLTYDYEHILILKKTQGKPKGVPLEIKEFSKISLSEWKRWYVGHWSFPGIVQKVHVAMFPDELPYRLIRMFSFIGDTILDPFAGSGTTLKVAKSLFRKSIGYELNVDFQDAIKEKIFSSRSNYFMDYQYLLYFLSKKAAEFKFSFDFKQQKRKGILVLKNQNDKSICIDYVYFEAQKADNEELKNELKVKLGENTVQNFLKEGGTDKYIIILNLSKKYTLHFEKVIAQLKREDPILKMVDLYLYSEFISEEFDFNRIFN
jgi:DNA modification methylase